MIKLEIPSQHNVLLLDDEESIRFTLNKYLKTAGYEVHLASDLPEARRILEGKKFEVAIVDRMLSNGQNGMDLLAHIQKVQPFCQTILISGYPSFDSAAKAIEYEPLAYLAKPVRKTDILDSVAEAVGRSREKKKAAQHERQFVSLFNSSPHAVAIYDLSGNVKFINPAFTRLFGYETQEAGGKALPIVPVTDLNETKRIMQDLIAGKSMPERETIRMTKDGREVEVALSLSLCRDEHRNPLEIMVNLRNISKSKRLERQLLKSQKMEAIGTLAGGIAHDFNNILFPIMGYTEMCLAAVPEDSDIRDYLEQILQGTMRAKKLVQQILAFSQQKEGEVKPLLIQPVIKEALALLKASLPSSIEIHRNVSNNCGPILADPTQIHQIIMNLSMNSYHALQEKGGILEVTLAEVNIAGEDVSTELSKTPGRYLRLTVRDTGHGMQQDVLDRIFEPYYTTKKRDEGTGLGLSVIHGIINNYGGDITVDSKPGKGTVFHVYLPRIDNDLEEDELVASEPVPGGNERILIVDDEVEIVKIMQEMLEKHDYHITARTSSIEALEAFRKQPERFDLVISDINMPKISGVEFASKLRDIRIDIPLIFCTGFSDKMNEEKAKKIGISAYILKPLLKREFLKTVRQALDTTEVPKERGKN